MKTLIGLALAAMACGQGGPEAAPDPAAPTGTLLVGNKGENTISFIDLATGRELGRSATGDMPHEIAVSPDGRQAAVVAYGGRTIDIFDVRTRARVRTIDLSPNEGPHGIAWLADGRILATTERSRSLTIVDTRRGDAVGAISTGQQGTHMVVVSPDHRHAFTANIQAGTVSVIDLAAGRLVRNFTVSGEPEAIALTPDGRSLWVGDLEGARVQAFDTAVLTAPDEGGYTPLARIDIAVRDGSRGEVESALRPLLRRLAGPGLERILHGTEAGRGWVTALFAPGTDMARIRERTERAVRETGPDFPAGRTEVEMRYASSTPSATLATGAVPIRLAASPDGRWIVASNLGSGSLTIIDARRRARVREVVVGGSRQAGQVTILFSADGRLLYAAETGPGQVAEIDMASGRVLRRLAAGAGGDGLAIAR